MPQRGACGKFSLSDDRDEQEDEDEENEDGDEDYAD